MSTTPAPRTVLCAKLGREAQGLDKPPFPGEVGREIYERVCAETWRTWVDDMMIKVINEYRLNMADPNDYAVLVKQMQAYLNLSSEPVVQVENEERGKLGKD